MMLSYQTLQQDLPEAFLCSYCSSRALPLAVFGDRQVERIAQQDLGPH